MRQRTTRHTTATIGPLVALLALLVFTPTASAFKVVSERGEGAGQTGEPYGTAVDYGTGRLFVAERKNNRVSVFDSSGTFEKAFGWGVKNGSPELQVCTTTCRKGLPGTGNGQFNQPTSIAVDNDPTSPSFHDVYVYDNANGRIEKFDPEGKFILAFGSAGEGEGQFNSFSTFVGVGPGGTVYVVDRLGTEGIDAEARLQKFEPSGTVIAPQRILEYEFKFGPEAMAVDSTGDVYISIVSIRKYGPNGGSPIAEFPASAGAHSLAVDSADHIFVADTATKDRRAGIDEYDSVGSQIRSFGYGYFDPIEEGTSEDFAIALAPYHSASGDIYSANASSSGVMHIDFPPPGPVVLSGPCSAGPLGNTKATLGAGVNPEGKATSYHFELVDDDTYQEDIADLGAGHGFDHAKREPSQASEDPSLPADFEQHEASAEVIVVPETKYHCRVIATNTDGTVAGEEGAFTSLPPLQIGANWSSGVGAEEATLNAEVNPLGISTTGYFQYVSEATYQKDIADLGPGHGFDHASKSPDTGAGEEPIEFGGGDSLIVGKAAISGLTPATSYRWRIVAIDPYFEEGLPGPAQTLRTFGAGNGGLPDDRAYELVSPGLKNSAEVGVRSSAGGLSNEEASVRIQAGSDSGEAVSYTSWTSFGEGEGAPSASQYLSKRTPGGWATENISPFGVLQNPLSTPYRGFTADLDFSAFVTNEPPLTDEAQTGTENLYLRDNQTGGLQALTVEAPQVSGGLGFCVSYSGATADGKHAIFAARGAMAGAPLGTGFSLYEWSAGKGLELVSVLPDGKPAPPVPPSPAAGEGTGFGGAGNTCTMGQGVVRNAISEDGSTIFWTYGGKYKSSDQPLMARIGEETVQLDAKPAVGGGSGPFGGGKFVAATGDGSKAFFTAPGKLTSSAAAAGQVYRYDTVGRTLTDLTPGAVAPEVQGVIGASEDGAYLYFVAKGALAGAAKKGANNLYLWHEGEGVSFIGALSELDQEAWSSAPEKLNARVTPDGRHLAFLSIETEALSGYNNLISPGTGCRPSFENSLVGDPHCAEAYLYDAEAKALTCVSCNPSGARPTGPAEVPGWTNPYEGPHVLSDDGSRFFFESRDVFSTGDENGKRDVYEFERAGSGSCDAGDRGFNPASGGCLSLVSSGKSEDESFLIDASASGRDVFFSTRSVLSGWDVNGNYDIYDAREGGGFPEPSDVPICVGEACKPPPATPPIAPSAATPNFQGSGNPVEKPKKKKKKSKHKAKKKQGKANHTRRAGR